MTSHLRTRARAREASDIGEPGPEENITMVASSAANDPAQEPVDEAPGHRRGLRRGHLAIGAAPVCAGMEVGGRHRAALLIAIAGSANLGVSDLCTGEGGDGKTIGNGSYPC